MRGHWRETARALWHGPARVTFHCLDCLAELTVPAGLAGQPFVCPACGFRTHVPSSALEADPRQREMAWRLVGVCVELLGAALFVLITFTVGPFAAPHGVSAPAVALLRVMAAIALLSGAMLVTIVAALRGVRLPYRALALLVLALGAAAYLPWPDGAFRYVAREPYWLILAPFVLLWRMWAVKPPAPKPEADSTADTQPRDGPA